jgi:hypothetical protein
MIVANNNSRVRRGGTLILAIGVLCLSFVTSFPKLIALANGIPLGADTQAFSLNQNRNAKLHRTRNKRGKKSLTSDEKEMTDSDKKKAGNRKAGSPQKEQTPVSGSGEASAVNGTAHPKKTNEHEGAPSRPPTNRDKVLDQVNLPTPVPPGDVRNNPPAPVNPPSSPAVKEPSTAKAGVNANRPAPARKPHRRKT